MESSLSPYTGSPFELFGASHLWTMFAFLIAGFWIVRAGMHGDEMTRTRLRWLMVGILVFWEIEWHVWHLATDLWSVQRQLPLHLCGIMMLVSIYGLWRQDRRVYPLMYFFGIAGSIQAVLTPDTVVDFPHIRYLNTMVSHGLLVVTGFWVVFVEGYRPQWRDVWVSLAILNVFALAVYPINLLTGSNYLFIVEKPSTASLLDFFPEWPWYVLLLELMAGTLLAAMCWPFERRGA